MKKQVKRTPRIRKGLKVQKTGIRAGKAGTLDCEKLGCSVRPNHPLCAQCV